MLKEQVFVGKDIKAMNWDNLRVGYTPYDKGLIAPGDRRRFAFYANERRIKYEVADPLNKYDIVYLTYGCNLSFWIAYKKDNPNTKIIFELIDSYLLENTSALTLLRGASRYFQGKENRLWLDYKTALRKIISISDAVVCSTEAQKMDMVNINKNIHISLDFFSNDVTHHKSILKSKNKFKLVWEGRAYTVSNLLLLKNVFEMIGNDLELYIITDPVIKTSFNKFNKNTINVLNKLKFDYNFIYWKINSFSKEIANADLAIIPIEYNNPMMWNKPENKLLLFWEIGIPVLTSDTPAYRRVMDAAGLELYCATSDDWVRKIKEYMTSSIEYKESIVKKSKDYIVEFHNKDLILKNWDGIFNSLQIELRK